MTHLPRVARIRFA